MDQPPKPAENETTLTVQLLRLRGEISDLDISEGRLSIQTSQLQVLISQTESYLAGAQASGNDAMASQAQTRLAAWRPQLASIQEQLAQIKAQKEQLNQQREAILEKLKITRAAAPASAGSYAGIAWPPDAPPWQPVRPRRRRWFKLSLWFAVLAALVALVFIGRAVYPSLLTPSSNQSSIVDPSFFKPADTAPSNMECLSQFDQPCYSPEDIQQAFRLNPLYKQGYTGKGQTIVIIGAGYTTTLQADLQMFDQAWGLPDPKLTILHPDGPTVPYDCGSIDGLQGENTLDVEWAHAIAPGANITLIIGSNNSGLSKQDNCFPYSFEQDVNYAVNKHLGQVISISYGGSELGSSFDTPADKAALLEYFQEGDIVFQQATQAGVTIVAATGDDGATNPNGDNKNSLWKQANTGWPASDPYVLAVGGTKLVVDPNTSTYIDETTWKDSLGATGGGLSAVYPEPDYQTSVRDQSQFHGKRGIPDVAFPAESFMVYESISPGQVEGDPHWQHWDVVGGTSASAPAWAGLIAIADQMRGQPLGQVQPVLYRLGGKDMHDITAGNNTYAGVQGYPALDGYDLVTGWGTPIANTFIPALVQASKQKQQDDS